jgi:osmotically-inducible protein OsmY
LCSSTQPAKEQVSDATITTKIKSKFGRRSGREPLQHLVETEEGTVYLTGRVNAEKEKQAAERLALETDGSCASSITSRWAIARDRRRH